MNPDNGNRIPQPQPNIIPYKKSVQFDLSLAQIGSVGPKVGDPSIRGGYSKAQIKRLNWMRSQDTETEHQVRAFLSWGNPSAPRYHRHNTLMRVPITPNDQRTIKTDRQNQEYKSKVYNGKMNQNEMKSHQRALLQNVQNNYSACSIPQRAINASILLAEQYYLFHLEYNRNDPATTIDPATTKTEEQLRIIKKEQINILISLGGIKIQLLHVERILEHLQLNGCI